MDKSSPAKASGGFKIDLTFCSQEFLKPKEAASRFQSLCLGQNRIFILCSQSITEYPTPASQSLPFSFDGAEVVVKTVAQVIQRHMKPDEEMKVHLASAILQAAIKKASVTLYSAKLALTGHELELARNLTVCIDILWFVGKYVVLGHVGHGRIYLLRKEALEQLTTDHTYANSMFSENILPEKEAKSRLYANKVREALGTERDPEIEMVRPELQNDDRLLMCTYGIHRSQGEDEIQRKMLEMASSQASVNQCGEALLKPALTSQRSAAALLVRFSFSQTSPYVRSQASAEQKMESIKSNPFFNSLSFVERTRLLEVAKYKTYEDQAILASDGEVPDRMWVIISGKVLINKGKITVAELGFGSVVGESIFIAQELRSATIVAKGRVGLLEFSKDDTLRLIEGFMNNTAARIYRSISVFQHYRLVEQTKKTSELLKKVAELESKLKSQT